MNAGSSNSFATPCSSAPLSASPKSLDTLPKTAGWVVSHRVEALRVCDHLARPLNLDVHSQFSSIIGIEERAEKVTVELYDLNADFRARWSIVDDKSARPQFRLHRVPRGIADIVAGNDGLLVVLTDIGRVRALIFADDVHVH